jgi:putative ABC transport system permease protein
VVEARERRITSVLAALEFSFAVVLAVSAVLLLRSLWNLTAVDPGFKTERLVTARVSPPGFRGRDATARHVFADTLLGKLDAASGVRSAAVANAIPFDSGLNGTVFQVEGRMDESTQTLQGGGATYLGVSDGYFRTMEMPLVEGREFTPLDGVAAPRVAIID